MNSKKSSFVALLVGTLFAVSAQAQTSLPASAPAMSERVITGDDVTYRGNFQVDTKGVLSGNGRIEWRNGNVYEGPVVNNLLTGVGKFLWSTGDRYEGELVNGEPHGQGTYFYRNGDRYVGGWQRGLKHGQARYIYADGSYWEGEYADDRQTTGRLQNVPGWAAGSRAKTPEAGPAGNLK